MAGEKSKPESNYLWRDTASGEDSLGFKPYVEAIAEFLTAEGTQPPITLSIEGEWGSGKSSFMKQLMEEIKTVNDPKTKRKKYFTVLFNCWKYEREDELWAAFALHFMEQLSEQLSWKRRQYSKLKLLWMRYKLKLNNNFLIIVHFSWAILSYIFIFSFLFFTITYVLNYLGMPSPFTITEILNYLGVTPPDFVSEESIEKFTNIVLILTPFVGLINYFFTEKWFNMFRDPFGLKKIESNTNYKEHIPFREHFYSDFDKIIKSYVGDSKVYVFIDDLDRCEVPKATELMQALILMVSAEANVYFSIGMNRKVISAGLAAKNEKVLKFLGVDGLEYGYEFIEKFIQLSFKVPIPKSEDFNELMNTQQEKESSSKASKLSGNLLSKFKSLHSSSQPDKESFQSESMEGVEPEEEGTEDAAKGVSDEVENILNDHDCDEHSEEFYHILEMVAPALDRNPRRVKQFFNLFRFQRTIGKRTGLFSYDSRTLPENMWNCKKLAKFVAISLKWPSLISDLGSNSRLLDQLQAYVQDPEPEALDPEYKSENLMKWIRDERLVGLLRYGCVIGKNQPRNVAEYTLSGLDFSKLLQISPVVTYPEGNLSSSLPEAIRYMGFVSIPAGEFLMGSKEVDNEQPVHKVNIRKPFYLGKYPVTQKQWEKVMGSNPSHFKGDDRPVENVSWYDVQKFIKKLNEMKGTNKYRLPSEAEWEYACRAGTTTRYSFGDDESKLWDYAWYINNSGGVETHPVGQKKPNSLDLYDMHGNVWEWVQDRWHDNYEGAPSDGNAWEDGNSSNRVIRGGGWDSDAGDCRSAFRFKGNPKYRYEYVCFRLLREL